MGDRKVMSLSTPVAFFIFNRPNLTKLVFEVITQTQPKKLLIVADGPRFLEEAEKCEKARSVIERLDWDCEVLTNFSETNMGCKRRVSSGLDWVFSRVEEAIILEDDCLPAPSFFYFCEALLEYYRHDERIMLISGDNFQSDQSQADYSYYFSKYNHIWGWASWRRAWNYYDVDMKTWPEYKKSNLIQSVCDDPYEQKYWTNIFQRVVEGGVNSWAYPWTYACWSQSGLSILPNSNLVSNIGFANDATHTNDITSKFANLPTKDISFPLRHPSHMLRNLEADKFTFDQMFASKQPPEQSNIYRFLCQQLSKVCPVQVKKRVKHLRSKWRKT